MKNFFLGILIILAIFFFGVWVRTGSIEIALFVIGCAVIGSPLFVCCLYGIIVVTTFLDFPMSERREIARGMEEEYAKKYRR